MTTVLQYSPAQTATIFLQVLDGYGNREDPKLPPIITRILLPNFTYAAGYPVYMNKLDRGLYFSQFQIPGGGAALGSYLVDVIYDNLAAGYHDGYCDGYRFDGYCDGYHDDGYHYDGYCYDGYRFDGYCDGYHYDGYCDGYYYDGYQDGYCCGCCRRYCWGMCCNGRCWRYAYERYYDFMHDGYQKAYELYQIVVNAPFGSYSASGS